MGKTAYLWVTMLTLALTGVVETRIVETDIYGDPAWHSDKETQP